MHDLYRYNGHPVAKLHVAILSHKIDKGYGPWGDSETHNGLALSWLCTASMWDGLNKPIDAEACRIRAATQFVLSVSPVAGYDPDHERWEDVPF